MRKIAYVAAASALTLMLAACGSTDDASTEASPENVEVNADAPLAGVDDPVDDPAADENNTSTVEGVEAAIAQGEDALDTVSDVANAVREGAENVQAAANGE
jgi:hypothetical protein